MADSIIASEATPTTITAEMLQATLTSPVDSRLTLADAIAPSASKASENVALGNQRSGVVVPGSLDAMVVHTTLKKGK